MVLDAGAPPAWPLADVLDLAFDDPARPAAVQLLVEQWGLAGAGVDPRVRPGRTYRSLPVRGLPLWNRVLLVIRHEPAWAPETVEARGGGATGARNALAAVAARVIARAARDGVRLRPLGADELAGAAARAGPRAGPRSGRRRRPRECRWAATTPSARCCAPWPGWT